MITNLYAPNRRSFAERALNAVLSERWAFLITLIALLSGSAVAIRRLPFVYEANSDLLIESPNITQQLVSGNETKAVGQLSAVGERVSPINNQVALIGSHPVFEEALAQLKVSEQQAPYSKLVVENISGTDLVRVSYSSESATLATRVVQAVVDTYVQKNLSMNREKAATARKFLEKRLPQLRINLQDSQDRLEQFQTSNRFLGTAGETTEISQVLVALEGQVRTAKTEFTFTEQKVASLKAQLPSNLATAVNVAGLNQEAGYLELQKQLVQAELQLVDLQRRLTADTPQVLSALEKRDQVRTLLGERAASMSGGQASTQPLLMDPLRQRLIEQWVGLETERAAQSMRLNQLTQQLRELQEHRAKLPKLIKRQARLQTEVDVAQREYATFLENYTASQIAEQQSISNARLVEPAITPTKPTAPNRKLLFSLALVLSTGLSLGVVWLRQRQGDRLESIAELEEILPLPVLATVPWSDDGRLACEEQAVTGLLVDSYRLLQANMKMLPQEVKSIAVCSWSSGEGRSSVARNLAILEAQSGRRVLLIDAGKPSGSEPEFSRFHLGEHSVAHRLNGNTPLLAAADQVMPGFDVLPSNNVPSPTVYKEWLVLLEQARQHYDLILLDCPPALTGPDATLLASMADGVLWAVCLERLGRRGAQAAAENLRIWNSRLLGQVIIKADGGSRPALPVGQPSNLLDSVHHQATGLLPGAR